MTSHYATAAVLAIAIGSLAWTAAKTEISRPPRLWIAKRKGRAWAWVSKLTACPYCLAHWMAFTATAIWRPWVITGWPPAQFTVTSLAIVAASMLPVLVIKKALT